MRAKRRNIPRKKLPTSNSNVTNALVNINLNFNFRDCLKFRNVRSLVNNYKRQPCQVKWLPKWLSRWIVIGAIIAPSLLMGNSFDGYDTAPWLEVGPSATVQTVLGCYDFGRFVPDEHHQDEP